jgi:hypothetical protein
MPDEMAEQETELSTFNAQRPIGILRTERGGLQAQCWAFSEIGMNACTRMRTNGLAKPRVLVCSRTNKRRLVLILCDRNGKLVEIRHVNSLR